MGLANKYRNSNKSQREGAGAYNARMKKEYMDRQAADVADFKTRQRKILDDKRANEQARKQEVLSQSGALATTDRTQTGLTKRQRLSEAGQTSRTGMTQTGATKRQRISESGLNSRHSKDLGLKQKTLDQHKQEFDQQSAISGKKLDLGTRGQAWKEYSAANRIGDGGDFSGGGSSQITGPEAIAGFNQYRGQSANGGPKGNLDGAFDVSQDYIDSADGRDKVAPMTPSSVARGDALNNPDARKVDVRGSASKKKKTPILRTNFGQFSGLNAAANFTENYFNKPLRQTWGALGQVGDAMVYRGIKPAMKWAMRERK